MKTYTTENKQIDIVKLINKQTTEPIIIKNNKGNEFLLMPFSENKKLDDFLMLYKSFSFVNKSNIKTEVKKKEKTMTAKEFVEKWTGTLKDSDIENWKDEYYEFLNSKIQIFTPEQLIKYSK